eukprot:440780-Rhodomonas_salina.1
MTRSSIDLLVAYPGTSESWYNVTISLLVVRVIFCGTPPAQYRLPNSSEPRTSPSASAGHGENEEDVTVSAAEAAVTVTVSDRRTVHWHPTPFPQPMGCGGCTTIVGS